MNKTLKKTLSIMLSILMIVTTMPMAFAADGHTHALSADGETVEFTELPADATRIDTAGNYYLTQDIELTNNLWIEVEGTVNLCLNGHSITAVEDSSNKTVVFLYGGTLNLCDCKGGGCITSAEDLTFSGVRALGDTEFNMYSGEIKNNYYYAVQGGNFNMYGGKLSGNKKTAVYVTDSFNMYGGEISGNSKSAIEGVAVEVYAGNFNMYGGEIKNNENISSYINASIVGVNGGATFTMYDGKICDNEGPAVYSGGTFIMNGGEISGNSGYSSGVSVGTGGIFTMNGGAIKNNTASGRGGGVYINERASFNMNGGEISSNTAEQGGGVFSTYDSAKINLKKGVITGNSATYAGGVGAQYANTPVEISGADVQIINNTATTYPDLRVNAPVTVSAPLDSAKTKISLSVNGYIIAKPDGTNLTTLKGMEDCFIQPYENLLVVCNSDGELEAIEWSASIAEKDGDLVVNAPNNDSVTYQWYEVNGEELTELEGETSDKLTADKIVLGKTYACQVYLEGEEMELLKIKCSYAITHQPTLEEPYVELNDDTDASYQWFEVEGKSIEITDENVRPFDPAETGIPAEFFSGTVTYDAEAGWSPMMLSDAGWLLYFVADLKAGEVVSVEFSSEFPMVVSLSGLTMDEEVYLTVDGNRAGGVVEKDGEYALKVECDIFDLTSLPLAKAYFDSEVYNSIEGATEAELADPVFGNTYACEVTFADGTTEMSDVLDLSYKITHQPTAAEPYVELNNYTDVTYQWYTVECNYAEITDENADTVAYDWGESSYSEETGWTGVPYEEEYNGQDFFTVELKAGETITVEVTGDFIDGVGLWDYDTENGAWVDSEEDVTSYELTVESEGNYTFYTYVNSGVVTVKAYKTAVEKTAIEGETSAELKNPEFGKKYVCEVTYGNGETEVSDAFEYTYAITHQPTEAEPYVELNDDTAASYQWYTVEGDGYEVTNENAFGDWQSIGFPISSTVYEDGKWIADDSMGMQYYFMVELEAGDTINFEFASEVEQIIFALDGNADEGIAVGGTECSVTVEESGAYWLITPPVDYVCADVGNIAYNAIEGETAAVLNPTALGKYACEVTFADGTTEMSDSFLVTTLHTCDFTGEWKYDADKHWKECTADGCSKISEEAEHSFTDSKCDCGYTCPHSSYTDGVCDNCEYACPHDSYTYTDNGDGTHDATCTACGAVVDNDAHTIENHVCTACGAMEIVVSFDAGDYEWKTGDTLYFCRVSRENEWEEYCFTATVAEDGTVTWTPDKTLYWDGTGEHKLVVRYPEWPGLAWDNWGVGADQTTSEKLRENDLMKAIWSGIPTTDTITLNLKHRLAKVSVNYEIAEDVAATVSKAEIYSLTQYLFFDTNTLDRVDVDWTKDYNLWINSYHTDNQFTAFVSPDAYAADGNFIKITLDNGTVYEVKMNKAVTFAEGAEYTYKVVITADGAYLTCADECTFEYTDNGDGTHNKVCSDCGDVIVNNENHTLTYTANGNTITATCSANCGYSGTATIGVEGKTYDGNAVEVVVSKTGSLENTIIPVTLTKDGEAFTGEPVNAGTYTASIGMGENENAVVASVEFIIEKANPVIAAAPTPNTLTYIGEAQYLISAGEAVGGTMVYSLTENGEYTTSIPQGTNAGDYTVWYYVQGDANHNDSAKDSVPVTIKKAPLTVTASDATITYGEAPTNNGVTYSGFVNGENEGVLGGELAYTYTYTQNGNVGNYSITPEGLTADNYEITFVDGTLTVEQIDIGDIIDEMKINLEQYSYVYDGTEKKPKVTSITVDGVTLTEGTDYTVRYEDNVNVGEEATAVITFEGNYDGTFRKWFTITKAYYDLTAPTPNTLTYNGEEQYLVSAGTVEGADFEYSLDAVSWSTSIPQAKDVGNYTVYYRVLADENHYGIEGTVDVTIKECTHTWNEGVLTRPTFETAGYYTYTCTLCGHSYTEPTKKADDTALNDASMKVMEYIGNDTLTQEAANEIHNSYLDILKNNGNIFDEFGFVRGDLIEEDQPAIDAVTEALEKIIADADEKIASGEYVKADYTKIDEAIDDIEEKLASENVTDEGKAELEEIKKQLEEMKADENTSAADVAELEKALEDYEEELDKGIEDGTLVEVDVDAIADDVNKKWAEKLEAEGLLDEYEDFINNQKATDEAMATVDEINDFANSLEGTVAENAENIAKLNEMLDSLYSSFENCLRGTHNFKDYETTSPAKCGENAVETSTCWFCGETDEREVEGTALEHSFTKYEETEAPKCGVAGKEVAYCDNGCQTTDERETPALEHIFLDYVSNGDATCTADGTKTASCLNGCGTTDTVADEGSMIDHSDEDGDKLCDDCGEEVYDRCDICGGKAHGDDKIQLVFCMIITIIRIVTAILKSIY